MSKKQEKHLQKAREIKARKNKKGLDSNDLMGKIDEFISHINVEEQAKGTNASNILNTLINAQKLKKENEILNGEYKGEIKPIEVKFISSDTPEQRLRIALIESQITGKCEETFNLIEEMRDVVNYYSKILRNYDDHNNLITDTNKVLEDINNRNVI